jgi:hypothetical protein
MPQPSTAFKVSAQRVEVVSPGRFPNGESVPIWESWSVLVFCCGCAAPEQGFGSISGISYKARIERLSSLRYCLPLVTVIVPVWHST